ncbi:MAG: HD domain-containing protein [Lachnospiraceae bacterium]|nr:HD domain-containing protein [Lachnospiraceae bacterium]
MRSGSTEITGSPWARRIAVAIGVAVNCGLAYVVNRSGLPLLFDTAGTICVAALAGAFPGMLTGVLTNLLCGIFNPYSVFYTLISVLIAMFCSWYVHRSHAEKKSGILLLALILGLFSGVAGMLFQWILIGGPQFESVAEAVRLLGLSGIGFFFGSVLINTANNLIDKLVMTILAFLVISLLPRRIKDALKNCGWKQKPLPDQVQDEFYGMRDKNSLSVRTAVMLVFASLALTATMASIVISLYYGNKKQEYRENAEYAARLAAGVIDPDKVDEYIVNGEEEPGYTETREKLRQIRDNSQGVKYLYILKVREDGCYIVFDLDTPDTPALERGSRLEFEEAFMDDLPSLLAGEEIEPIESDDVSGWVLTAYHPVRNAAGKTVCYAGADVSMLYLSGFVRDFLVKTILIFSGFFILVLSYGLWVTKYYYIFPVVSITRVAKGFAENTSDQKALDENVRKIKDLSIHTGDEVEELYQSLNRMSADMAEQVRRIRYYAAETASMQNGLIITMADMVESRDSDTGAHVQKTAAYVRIILEGLKKKGYYTKKITPNYISDVEMSAPLHDVGKINIPDAVLNKPGKLTEEEYEIMKTHTTAGKRILENAINTVHGGSYLREARNMAAYHHERWDGKGYPEKLHGEVIPLSARVMAVADVFDALTSKRVYKPPFSLEKALEIIQDGSGTQFDPKCVEALMDSLPEVKVVLKKYNNYREERNLS